MAQIDIIFFYKTLVSEIHVRLFPVEWNGATSGLALFLTGDLMISVVVEYKVIVMWNVLDIPEGQQVQITTRQSTDL